MRQKGFTLLEVMIAIMIMAFLSLFTVQAIQNALKAKTKVQKEIDKTSTLRDALRVIERDINMAFNYRDINIQLYNMAQKERQKKAQTQNNTVQNQAPVNTVVQPPQGASADPEKYKLKTEKVLTHFLGQSDSIDFTTLSNIRMAEDSKISSQAEVGYKLKSCRRRSTQEQSSQCLWRRVSNFIHEDITKEGEETVLLENITEFKLRYLGPGKQEEWVDQWMTNEQGDDTTRGVFPYAVEITLEVKDTDPNAKDKSLRMTSVAAIRNPNNPVKKTEEQGGLQNEHLPPAQTPGGP